MEVGTGFDSAWCVVRGSSILRTTHHAPFLQVYPQIAQIATLLYPCESVLSVDHVKVVFMATAPDRHRTYRSSYNLRRARGRRENRYAGRRRTRPARCFDHR